MEEYFGTKELYDVSIKSTFPMKIGSREIEENEPIIHFNNIEISTLDTVISRVAAVGGFDNRPQVIWEHTKQINFSLSNGVLSKTYWALMNNSKVEYTNTTNNQLLIDCTEELETNESGVVILKHEPRLLFVYNKETGKKIKDYQLNEKTLTLKNNFLEIVVNYVFPYTEEAEQLIIGKKLLDGFVKLEGKIELKDDKTGIEKTGILKIPKMIMASDLSLRLGMNAQPTTGTFNMIGFPVGGRGNSSVCSITFLEDNLRSDV